MRMQSQTEERLEAAGDWLLRLDEDEQSQQTLADWLKWYGADERNREAFEQMQSMYASVRDIGAGQRQWLLDTVEHGQERRVSAGWRLAFAATVLLACGGAWTLLRTDPQSDSGVYSTARATHRVEKLPDGSEVRIGAASSISFNYTSDARYLALEGEAYFDVSPDPNRPFVVQAGSAHVRVIGTAFNVRRAEQRVVVTVRSGAVDVAAHESVRVTAGLQALVDTERGTVSLEKVDPDAALAWLDGRLEFINEPMPAVLATVNRYSRQKLVLAGDSLEVMTYTGTVQEGRIDEWLAAVESVFPLRVTAVGSDLLVLRKN